jgi:hypothetical protein
MPATQPPTACELIHHNGCTARANKPNNVEAFICLRTLLIDQNLSIEHIDIIPPKDDTNTVNGQEDNNNILVCDDEDEDVEHFL